MTHKHRLNLKEYMQKHSLLLLCSNMHLTQAFVALSHGKHFVGVTHTVWKPVGGCERNQKYQMATMCVCANVSDFEM